MDNNRESVLLIRQIMDKTKIIKGKYFLLAKTTQPLIVKFKSRDENFFSANTIIEDSILPYTFQEIEVENERYYRDVHPFSSYSFKILGLKNIYYTDERINFVIFNNNKEDFELRIIVTDEIGHIRYENRLKFSSDIEWKDDKFKLLLSGDYKVIFYYNGKYNGYKRLHIMEKKNELVMDVIKEIEDKIVFKLFKEKEEIKSDLEIKEYSLLSGERFYRTLSEKIPVKEEIIYVPIKKIFSDIDKTKLLSKIAIKSDYNPAGLLKVISTIEAMSELDEVRFIKNLFNESPDIAYFLAEEIYDSELLFSMNVKDLREVLNMIDDKNLSFLVKELKGKQLEHIKNNISENRWEIIENVLKQNRVVYSDEFMKANDKIGKHIRSYFQAKYGHCIDTVMRKDERWKIVTIADKLKYNEETKSYIYYKPSYFLNGDYVVTMETEEKEKARIILNISDKKDVSVFYEYIIYASDHFWNIVGVNDDFLYLKFNYDIKKIKLVVVDENNSIIEIYDNGNILNDEIIKIDTHKLNSIRMIIGAYIEKSLLLEADVVVDIYRSNNKAFFISDITSPNKDIVVNKLKKKLQDFFLFYNNLSLPFTDLYKDFIEVEKAEQFDIRIPSIDENLLYFYEKSGEMIALPALNRNSIDNITLFYNDNNEMKFFNKTIFRFYPVILEYYPEKEFKKGYIVIHNPFQKVCNYKIMIDTDITFAKGTFKAPLFITDIKFFDFCKVEIKNIFGTFNYLIENKEEVEKQIEFDLDDKNEIKRFLNKIKESIYEEKKVTLDALFLRYKIALFEEDKIVLDILKDVIIKNYFNVTLFKDGFDNDFDLKESSEILNRIRILYEIKDENFISVIDEMLQNMRKMRFKNKSLWIYGKKYSDEYSDMLKYLKRNMRDINRRSTGDRFYLLRNIMFTKLRKNIKQTNLKNVKLDTKFYMEDANNIIDLLLFKNVEII